ncbi:hypothetical protein ACFL59_03420 [Planctomycetota bacterium]
MGGPSPLDSRLASPALRALLDRALRENGNLGVYGDLSAGLEALEAGLGVLIDETPEHYVVLLDPLSGESHDFTFRVRKADAAIEDVAVGEIEPEPTAAPTRATRRSAPPSPSRSCYGTRKSLDRT